MLSNGFDAPLQLTLRPSKLLFNFQIVVYLLALLAMTLPMNLPWYIRVFLILLVCHGLIRCIRSYRKQGTSTERLNWNKISGWQLSSASSESGLQSPLSHQCLLVTPWFVWFRLTNKEITTTILLVKDQVAQADEFRRLRVLLKYSVAVPTDTGQVDRSG